VGIKIGTMTIKSHMEMPQKDKDKLPYDPVILLLDIYPRNVSQNIIDRHVHQCSSQYYSK
jgi:hypothetical protein